MHSTFFFSIFFSLVCILQTTTTTHGVWTCTSPPNKWALIEFSQSLQLVLGLEGDPFPASSWQIHTGTVSLGWIQCPDPWSSGLWTCRVVFLGSSHLNTCKCIDKILIFKINKKNTAQLILSTNLVGFFLQNINIH